MIRILVMAAVGVCLAQPPGWAVLTLKEYEALRARPTVSPEFAAALARIDYDLRVDGATAVGKAALTIDVAKTEGWATVALPPGLAVASSTEPLVTIARDQRSVLLRGAGRSIVTLDVAVPADGDTIALPASNAAITQVILAPPARDVTITVIGGILTEESPQRWRAFASGGGAMRLAWKRRAVERPFERPLRARGEITQVITLGEDSASITAEISA